jgi:hypothetical protein
MELLELVVDLLFALAVVYYVYSTDKRLDKLKQKKDGGSNAY